MSSKTFTLHGQARAVPFDVSIATAELPVKPPKI